MKVASIRKVINCLTRQELNYKVKGDFLSFTLYSEFISFDLITETGEATNGDIINYISTLNGLFNYILIRHIVEDTFLSFKDEIVEFNNLHIDDKLHMQRIVKKEGVSSIETLYNNIMFTFGSPDDVGKMLGISPTLVKSVRSRNRKHLIKKIVHDVLSEQPQG